MNVLHQIQNLLEEYKDDNIHLNKLIERYIVRVKERIQDNNLPLPLLYLLSRYKNVDDIFKLAVESKILEIRALILDLVDADYTKDKEQFMGVEQWMKDMVINIKQTVIFEEFKNESIKFVNLLDKRLLEENKAIFLKNKKLGSNGNLLLINFRYYLESINEINTLFDVYYDSMKNSFREGAIL
ncbi:hypothetical protein SLOPH_1772, partial [Spraguea lophii 42_110]